MSTVKRKFGGVIISVICTLLLSLLAYFVITRFFTITEIEVIGSGIDVVIDKTKFPKNLLLFPVDAIRKEIIKNNPVLADVEFRKKFPHTLILRPVVRSPVAKLKTNDQIVLVDRDGVVITYGDQGLALPIFEFVLPAVRVGEKVNSLPLQSALEILERLQRLDGVRRVIGREESYTEFQTEKTNILIAHNAQSDKTIATLQTLFEGFRIKGTLPRVVDLRFDKPVVQF